MTEESPTVAATATATLSPTATAIPETFLGDVIEHDGISFAAVQVEDPATPGLLYQKQEGKRLVAVQVIVGNVSTDPMSVNVLDITLLDQEGFAYQSDLGGRDGQLSLVTLSPGEKVIGWAAYQIPTEGVPEIIRYSVSTFSDIQLEASLAEPPTGHIAVSGSPRTAPTLSKLGDAVEQGGYAITPVTLEDPAKASSFYSAQKGTRLVAVELVLANISGAKESSSPLDFYLIDTNGFVYPAELGARSGQLELIDLNAGNKVKGWVAFQIQADAVPESVKYMPNFFSELAIVAGLAE